MKLQQSIPLKKIYAREEAFSEDLANTLHALDIGSFEDAETEANVGTRQADIVAVGTDENDILVVENQFGKANWDHWGRLEAYARLKKATVAVLVAESFEELMIVTCSLRNEDSEINWYLIEVHANAHHELSFHHVVQPAIDIQIENAGVEYSEFWEPIRQNGLFSGKPIPVKYEGRVEKRFRGAILALQLSNHRCSIQLSFQGSDRFEHREQIMRLFPESEYNYEHRESSEFASVVFPVLDKGKKDREDLPEIREELVSMGTDIYNRINESDI